MGFSYRELDKITISTNEYIKLDEHAHSKCSNKELTKIFYDFYAIDYVSNWIKSKIINHQKEYKIHEYKEYTTLRFASIIAHFLELSVRSEASYAFYSDNMYDIKFNNKELSEKYNDTFRPHFSSYGIVDNFKHCEFLIKNNIIAKFLKKEYHYNNVDLNLIYRAYKEPFWAKYYGGQKWAIATEYLIDLKKELNKINYNIKKITLLVDKILDLQHNTGFILNKTKLGILGSKHKMYDKEILLKGKIRKRISHLDNRFYLKKLEDYKPYISYSMRNILTANKNNIPV